MSRTVPFDPGAVWRLLSDASRRPDWCPGVTGVEAAPSARVSPGDGWTETRDVFGVEETERVEVGDVADGSSMVLEVDGDAGSARSGRLRFTWTLTPVDEGTRVGVTCDAGALDRKGAILLRFLGEPWARQVEEELEGLEAGLGGGGVG